MRTTAGPGSQPLPVSGRVYLTGPYGGAPFGLSIVVPTAGQAGPFDLGTVVVRARITVDRRDAHVTVASDPMPTILRGIPLRVRSLLVAIDVDVDVDSSVDRRRRLVSTFAGLPDAPLTSFDLRLNSGRHGILRIPPSRQGGTCRRDKLVGVELSGHNGGVRRIATRLAVAGCRSVKRPQARW